MLFNVLSHWGATPSCRIPPTHPWLYLAISKIRELIQAKNNFANRSNSKAPWSGLIWSGSLNDHKQAYQCNWAGQNPLIQHSLQEQSLILVRSRKKGGFICKFPMTLDVVRYFFQIIPQCTFFFFLKSLLNTFTFRFSCIISHLFSNGLWKEWRTKTSTLQEQDRQN